MVEDIDADVSTMLGDFFDDLRSLCGGGPMSQCDIVGGCSFIWCSIGRGKWWKCLMPDSSF